MEKGKCVGFALISASTIFGGCTEPLVPVSPSIHYIVVWLLKISWQQMGFWREGASWLVLETAVSKL